MNVALWVGFVWSALASDAEFELLKQSEDCSYYFKEGGDSVPSMKAVCEWTDVSIDQLDVLLQRYEQYDDLIFPIAVSQIRSTRPDATLLFQRHKVFAFAPRESLVWIRRSAAEDGFEVRWRQADDQSLTLTDGAVETKVNEGFWRVLPSSEGGVRIEHQVRVDAGPGLPQWLVSFFRTQGFIRIMHSVRSNARGVTLKN